MGSPVCTLARRNSGPDTTCIVVTFCFTKLAQDGFNFRPIVVHRGKGIYVPLTDVS